MQNTANNARVLSIENKHKRKQTHNWYNKQEIEQSQMLTIKKVRKLTISIDKQRKKIPWQNYKKAQLKKLTIFTLNSSDTVQVFLAVSR